MATAGLPDGLQAWFERHSLPGERPLVTLSYAQSLDGCLAAEPGRRLRLSSEETKALTHQVRAWHDGILVGIGTVLADDPHLTVRRVSGPSPQPIIADTRLRTPPQARLLGGPRPPWIAASESANPEEAARLREGGAEILIVPQSQEGLLDLSVLLHMLRGRGVQRLMVEGGARILTSFLRANLADALILTVAPRIVGGLPAVGALHGHHPSLVDLHAARLGPDLVVWGDLAGAA
jgi:riboflavin-specific deaminase-like protein